MNFNNIRKALLAFVALFVTNVTTELMKDGNVLPTNWGDAARWLLTIGLGTAAVYSVRPAKGVNTPPAAVPPTPYNSPNPHRPLG